MHNPGMLLSLLSKEISIDYVHSSGPGGQNVNKVATAVQLRLNVRDSLTIPPDIKDRLAKLAGRRLTDDGILVIDARRFRSQDRNRADAMERLDLILRRAMSEPKIRHPTYPSAASRARRLTSKKNHSMVKQFRKPVKDQD